MAEIEITPEMIEAGVEAFCLWDSDELASLVVTSVFSAMICAAPAPAAEG